MQNMAGRRTAGFNLLELLITLSFMSVLSSLALPSYSNWSTAQRAKADAQTVLRLLQMTRSEAIQGGRPLTFCGTDENQLCVATQVRQWQVFEDVNSNGRVDEGETVFQTAKQNAVALTAVTSSRNPERMIFGADGSADSFGSALICHLNGSQALLKRVSSNRSGRVYIVPKKKIKADDVDKFCK